MLIGRCAIYEQLYLTGDVPTNAKEATENLRRGLLALYTAILQALCKLIRIFESRIPHLLIFKLVFPCAWRVLLQSYVRPSKANPATRKIGR